MSVHFKRYTNLLRVLGINILKNRNQQKKALFYDCGVCPLTSQYINSRCKVYSVIPKWRDKAEYNFLHEVINQRKRFSYREQLPSPRVSCCKVQRKPKVKKNEFKTRCTERGANKSLNYCCTVFLTEYKKK